ncbi:MAG: ribonuclease D [Alphaproteobacteria bacterium]|nr:ribonuclease D [Alphaproteobacteria bacterium]
MTVTLHRGDLPAGLRFGDTVAIDTETMGLSPPRDRLCLVQISSGDGNAHVVQLRLGAYGAPNLRALLGDPNVTKLFHFARFDVAALRFYLGILASPIWCTKIASKLARTYTDRHGLKDLCKELLGVELSKQVQSSDWGADTLTEEQINYAGSDVIYLHRLQAELERMLQREDRLHLAQAAFAFLPIRSELDLGGWQDLDIFAH